MYRFEFQKWRIKRGALFPPQRLDDLERVIEKMAPSLELQAGRVVFFLLPADTDWKKGFTTQFVKDLKNIPKR